MKKVFNFFYNEYRDLTLNIVLILHILIGIIRTSTLSLVPFFHIISLIIQGICVTILVVYLLIDLIKRKFKITPFLIIGVVCTIGTLIFSHNVKLCYLLGFIYAFKDRKFSQIAWLYAVTVFSALVVIFCLSLTGCIGNFVQTRGELARECLGFRWSVPPMTYFFFACLACNYAFGKKTPFLLLAFELVTGIAMYHLTHTRTGFVLVCILVLTTFLYKILNTKKIESFFSKDKINKSSSVFFSMTPIFLVLLFGFLVFLFSINSNIGIKANHLLSRRLEYTYNAFINKPITPFGGIFDWTAKNGDYIGVDSAFYHYLFNCGFLTSLFVLVLTIFILYKAFREKKYWLCFALLLCLCESFIDIFYWNLSYNIFLLSIVEGNVCEKKIFGNVKKEMDKQDKKEIHVEEESLKKIKLSIIIPVHNGEKFIKKTIDKLLQVKLNKELIVINDCSTDNSLKILQTYYDQIILINLKENHGVSYARNLGLQKATGNYVTFIDIDDDFEIDMHGKILAKMLQEQASVGICKNDIINEDGKLLDSGKDVDFGVLNQEMVIKYYLCNIIVPAVWNSVYDATLAKSVRFEEQLKIGEDILYPLQVLLKAQKTCFVNETLYHYIQHPTSAMHELSDKLLGYLKVTDYLTNGEKEKLTKLFPEEFNYFKLEMVKRTVNSISLIAKGNKSKAANMLKSFLTKDTCLAIIKNEHSPRYIKFEFLVLKIFGINIHLFVFPVYALLKTVLRR